MAEHHRRVCEMRDKMRKRGLPPTLKNVSDLIFELCGKRERERERKFRSYKRSLKVARIVDQWISIVLEWSGRQWVTTPEAARDEVYGSIEDAGQHRAPRLGELFNHLEQIRGQSPAIRLRKLRLHREQMRADPLYWPPLRKRRAPLGDWLAADVMKLVRAKPDGSWTTSKLAKKYRVKPRTMGALLRCLVRRRLLNWKDKGKYVVGLPGCDTKWSAARRLFNLLLDAPNHKKRYRAAQRELGQPIGQPVGTLRRLGLLTPKDPNPARFRRPPLELSNRALDLVAGELRILNGIGGIVYEPDGKLRPLARDKSDVPPR